MVPLFWDSIPPVESESPGGGALKLLGDVPLPGTGVGVVPVGLGAVAVALGDCDGFSVSVVDFGPGDPPSDVKREDLRPVCHLGLGSRFGASFRRSSNHFLYFMRSPVGRTQLMFFVPLMASHASLVDLIASFCLVSLWEYMQPLHALRLHIHTCGFVRRSSSRADLRSEDIPR